MKAKLIYLLIGGLSLASFTLIAQAQNGYSSSASGHAGANGYSSSIGVRTGSEGANGYSSSGSTQSGSTGTNGYTSSGSKPNNQYDGYNGHGDSRDTYFVVGHARHLKSPFWINMFAGAHLPGNAVSGGGEQGHPLFVCRGNFRGGVHPGKIVGNTCHISYGGQEIALTHYQVLTSNVRLAWIPASNGFIPNKAIKGGHENQHSLYICQAAYNGGIHPGKIVAKSCNIAWGGREVSLPVYKVLVR